MRMLRTVNGCYIYEKSATGHPNSELCWIGDVQSFYILEVLSVALPDYSHQFQSMPQNNS